MYKLYELSVGVFIPGQWPPTRVVRIKSDGPGESEVNSGMLAHLWEVEGSVYNYHLWYLFIRRAGGEGALSNVVF